MELFIDTNSYSDWQRLTYFLNDQYINLVCFTIYKKSVHACIVIQIRSSKNYLFFLLHIEREVPVT